MITLTTPIPPSVNRLYKQGNRGWYKDKKAVDWQEQVLWLIKQKRFPEGNYDSISVCYYRKDKRKFDIDNPVKLLLDTITKSGLIKDDSLITTLIVRKLPGESNYCLINLYESAQ
jgi:Holliday junction resolvase RusA-like endonuclease